MNDDRMQEVTEVIKGEVINYLSSIPLIDELVEKNEIRLNVEPPVSTKGYHLDYGSLQIQRISYPQKKGNLYETSIFFWEMPYRIKQKNKVGGTHVPGKSITGVVDPIKFELKFDETTGEPLVRIQSKINSSRRVSR